jgi:uncharacterized UPF0160 family protein
MTSVTLVRPFPALNHAALPASFGLPLRRIVDIIRTRDPAELAKCDILVDVGAVYDPSTHRYDHHQAGFTETFDDTHKIKLSSAGLIYKYVRQTLSSLACQLSVESVAF